MDLSSNLIFNFYYIMATIIIIAVMAICICSCSSFSSSVSTLLGVQFMLDDQARNKKIALFTEPTLGMCPSEWRKNDYANGLFCIEPGVYAIVDSQNNFIDARRGICTKGKIISSTQVTGGTFGKQYFCESY